MLRTDASRENLRIAPAAAARDGGKDSQSRAELSVSPVRCLVGLQRDGNGDWDGREEKGRRGEREWVWVCKRGKAASPAQSTASAAAVPASQPAISCWLALVDMPG